jgi:hypothetical protein
MPGGKQRRAGTRRQGRKQLHFANSHTGRLFQQHMLSGMDRLGCRLETQLWWLAQGDRIECKAGGQQLLDGLEHRNSRQVCAGTCARDQLEPIGCIDCRQVLSVRDLAEPDHRDAHR